MTDELVRARCRLRSVGILRWPHRRFKAVADSYSYVAHVLSSTLNSFELGMKSLEKYGTTTCSTSIFRNFRQLDVAVQELQRDLNDLEDYAYELERSFLHTGQVETVVLTPAIRKLLGKLYKHRSSISKYTRRVVRGCCK